MHLKLAAVLLAETGVSGNRWRKSRCHSLWHQRTEVGFELVGKGW